ncbi:MAG TPA: hypothetical protein VD907_02150 [Verrucomicrobiae bacterium]|nr:hypothetical protein [Verrucomicrobiae bacterium]
MRTRLLIIGVVAIFVGLFLLINSAIPNSTPGVSIVGGNIARLPQGEAFVLTYRDGKTDYIWKITHDNQVVKFSCLNWFCPDLGSVPSAGLIARKRSTPPCGTTST